MENYKHILFAVDLHAQCDKATVAHGLALAKEHQAKVTLVHAVEHFNAYGAAQAYPTLLDLEEQMVTESKQTLTKLRSTWGVPEADIFIEIGSPKIVILDKAKELGVDLIVIGSHGRHGLSALMGSTANAVLHHAQCDVLAVRIKE